MACMLCSIAAVAPHRLVRRPHRSGVSRHRHLAETGHRRPVEAEGLVASRSRSSTCARAARSRALAHSGRRYLRGQKPGLFHGRRCGGRQATFVQHEPTMTFSSTIMSNADVLKVPVSPSSLVGRKPGDLLITEANAPRVGGIRPTMALKGGFARAVRPDDPQLSWPLSTPANASCRTAILQGNVARRPAGSLTPPHQPIPHSRSPSPQARGRTRVDRYRQPGRI